MSWQTSRMFKEFILARRSAMKTKFNRHVSAGDLIFDRWESAKFYGFGEGSSIYDNVLILGDVVVGSNCWIGPNVILDGSGGLTIGDGCTISAGAHLYSHNNVLQTVSNGAKPIHYKETKLGENVYVGPNAIICCGVTIGDRAIIGASSFVNKDIDSDQKYHPALK